MSEADPLDRLLAQVPEVPEQTSIDEAELAALRAGHLAPTRRANLEARLGADPESRALLIGMGRGVSAKARARAEAALPTARRRAAPWIAAAALAAAVFLTWGLWPGAQPGPGYMLEGPFGGLQAARSEAVSQQFGSESRLRLVLRPEGAGAEAVRVFSAGPAGVRLAEVDIQRGATGAFRVEAPASALFTGPPGARTLHILIGSRAKVDGLTAPDDADGVTHLRVEVVWVGGSDAR